MDKNIIKKILLSMKTQKNESFISSLLQSLNEVSNEELNTKLIQLNVNEDNILSFLANLIEKRKSQEELEEGFININEWFSYGRIGGTIHMHLIPKDLRIMKKELGYDAFYRLYSGQLEDCLAKLQSLFLSDSSINSLFAVSPIFYKDAIAMIHESLGFDKAIEIDLNNENDNMSKIQKEYFISMFNKGE